MRTTSPTSIGYTQDLMLSMMGAVAQFERSMISESQAEGIAKAKARCLQGS